VTIPLSGHAPGQARHALDRYRERIEEGVLDDLRLLTSELVSNAVTHSRRGEGDPITVTFTLASERIRVEVVDRGEGVVELRPRSIAPPSGLQFVELISDRWSSLISNSFHVWFEIDVTENHLLHR
jgi:hypothetical protein